MTLQEYYESLGSFLKDHPEAAKLPVVYAKDDEGNGYQNISYSPSLGEVDSLDYCIESFDTDSESPNAVCIN